MLFDDREKATGSSWIADPTPMNTGSPHWHPAIQRLLIRQNVAGLWLKCGAEAPKIEASSRRKNKKLDATIC
jgi:hypothetical protein